MRSDPPGPGGAAPDAPAPNTELPNTAPPNTGSPNAPPPGDAARPAAVTSDGAAREQVLTQVLRATGPAAAPAGPSGPPPPPEPPRVPPVVEVEAFDWDAVRRAVDPAAVRARLAETCGRLEALLDRPEGPGLLFDADRAAPDAAGVPDRAVRVAALAPETPLWFVGDLHGDLLALEAALVLAHTEAGGGPAPHFVFLGDLFDDGGHGLEVLLRVFELAAADPARVCVVAGNHDEALGWAGARFTSFVSPSDFAERLDADLAAGAAGAEDAARAARLAVRFFARAPRALFFPDGLLVTHAGVPLVDLHAQLEASGDWNDPRVLTDFAWTRAHPKARRKLPNRASRGSQFGHEDFADFCALAARLGRPVTHLVRGHDHVEERWAVYPAWAAHPILTTVALSRRLPREVFGPYVRVPTVARWVPGALPQVYRLHLPEADVRALYPEQAEAEAAAVSDAPTAPGAPAEPAP